MRASRPALIFAVVLAAVFGAGVTPAKAALSWSSCVASGYSCASLTVPLDRSGKVPGTVRLSATRKVSANNPTRTAVVAFAGGPGQAAQPFTRSFARLLAGGLTNADLLVFDQRGTGKSSPLQCAALKRSGDAQTLVGQCANQLGARRAFYRSFDSVEDLEALRIEGGYEKLTLYGVSYGTKVALEYAAVHPDRVQSLILDSVVLPEGPDALRRGSALAAPRVIGDDLCAAGACREATPNAVSDLTTLVSRLSRTSMSAAVFSGSGGRFTAKIGASGLLNVLTAGDLNPAIRAQLPAAIRSALKGDRQPLLRLSALSAGLDNGTAAIPAFQADDASDEDDGSLYLATLCEENPTFPWTRGASIVQRAQELDRAIRSAPAGSWGIFPSTVAAGGFAGTCLGWNVASPAPAPPGALPDVPTLVLSGRADLRTPLEDAKTIASRFRQATLVEVPKTGHSVLTGETGECGKRAVTAFLRFQPIAQCADEPTPYNPTARVPVTLADVTKARNLPSKAGRTLNAIPATLTDARRQIIGDILATGEVPKALGGLRGGSVRVLGETRWQLRSYQLVRGVRVSGTFRANGSSTFTVSGPSAAAGVITLSKSGRATGRLGGVRINAASRASAASATTSGGLDTLSFAQARALTRGPR